MTVLRVRILEKTGCFLGRAAPRTCMKIDEIIISFLPPNYEYIIVKNEEKADICLFSIWLNDKKLLRDNEVNILISIENVSHWNWYPFNKKFGDFGLDKIDIYFYNHYSNIFYMNNKLIIPTIYGRMNHYQIINKIINKPSVHFKDRKFCLMINRSGLNPLINNLYIKLEEIGKVDNIKDFNISNSSCYNSSELLNLFGQYKFIICFENSKNDGYITEKIFNCFFAKTIPLYWGSDKVFEFFNYQSLIKVDDDIENFNLKLIKLINEHEDIFNTIIFHEKINPLFFENNCYELIENIIKSKLRI